MKQTIKNILKKEVMVMIKMLTVKTRNYVADSAFFVMQKPSHLDRPEYI